ncbi:hypothetical protein CSIM01_05554 [Colletotrichum simmondsii]|uniref:Uncharacterized protein n=1 Tax=Colletotrichum simmondsii TaxID=703756 RepID=A0A135S1Q0_9PEZI|nr:hypothetical protein CSIM01_05554 [Colletotrichum simmondsii]
MGRRGKAPSSLPHRHFGIQGWARLDPDSGLCASLAAAADYSSRLSHHLTWFPGFYANRLGRGTLRPPRRHSLSPFPSSPPPPLSSEGLEKYEDDSWELKLTLGWRGKHGKLPAEPPPWTPLSTDTLSTWLATHRASCIDGRASKKQKRRSRNANGSASPATGPGQQSTSQTDASGMPAALTGGAWHGSHAVPCHATSSTAVLRVVGQFAKRHSACLAVCWFWATSKYGQQREVTDWLACLFAWVEDGLCWRANPAPLPSDASPARMQQDAASRGGVLDSNGSLSGLDNMLPL